MELQVLSEDQPLGYLEVGQKRLEELANVPLYGLSAHFHVCR